MTESARIGLATALLLGGATFAMAQNGPATGGYPPARWNPNLGYGYYNDHYAQPRYALGPPYYVLGYPVAAGGGRHNQPLSSISLMSALGQ